MIIRERWHLENPYDGLSLLCTDVASVGEFANSLPLLERRRWRVWKADWKEKISLEHATELLSSLAYFPHSRPLEAGLAAPVPEIDGSERRRQPRYDLRVSVTLLIDHRKFQTFSRDLSLGGLRVEKKIPLPFLMGPCEIYLAHPSGVETLRFKGRLASSQGDPSRIAFVNADTRFLERLQAWLSRASRTRTKAA